MMIAFKGGRGVGKSTLASHLVESHGFARAHPFDGGKAASKAYFMHLGADSETAELMITGPLKDIPSPVLPVSPTGENFAPRYFLEKFGAFMGTTMGPSWTIRQEIEKLQAEGADRIIFESIAFEADTLRDMGGIIIEIVPLNERGKVGVVGIETDAVVSRIKADFIFQNAFSSNVLSITEKEALFEKLDAFLEITGILEPQPGYALEI